MLGTTPSTLHSFSCLASQQPCKADKIDKITLPTLQGKRKRKCQKPQECIWYGIQGKAPRLQQLCPRWCPLCTFCSSLQNWRSLSIFSGPFQLCHFYELVFTRLWWYAVHILEHREGRILKDSYTNFRKKYIYIYHSCIHLIRLALRPLFIPKPIYYELTVCHVLNWTWCLHLRGLSACRSNYLASSSFMPIPTACCLWCCVEKDSEVISRLKGKEWHYTLQICITGTEGQRGHVCHRLAFPDLDLHVS